MRLGNYVRLPVASGHPEGALRLDFWGSYHDFVHVFDSGDSPKAGSTKVGEKGGRTGRNVQAKSRRYFRFRIFAVRPFVTLLRRNPARLQSFSGNFFCTSLPFFIT